MNCENDSCVTETLSGDHVSELAHEYAAYTTIHITKEKAQFEDSVELLLNRLDEYCQLVDLIRSDTNLCLNSTLPHIYAKSQQMKAIFERIDKLEAFVGVVRRNVSTIEDVVVKAESDVGSVSSVKKMLQMFKLPLFGTSKKPNQSPKQVVNVRTFVEPEIFRTDDYLRTPTTNDCTQHSKD
ncbi:Biogenesis of lysosome-related organelles complex 1 subunit 4 [Lamellibrachia satsuma]|nr:Biogenesis of lysosome-related organelles complex 1 subunit 4 [Lamellibrachia satsuma]